MPKKKKELTLTIRYTPGVKIGFTSKGFACSVEGTGIDADRYNFWAIPVQTETSRRSKVWRKTFFAMAQTHGDYTPLVKIEGKGSETYYAYTKDFAPIATAIEACQLSDEDFKHLTKEIESATEKENKRIDFNAVVVCGELIKGVLEKTGYLIDLKTIEVPDYYFPSPTSMGIVAPVFSLGLRKELGPDITPGYETTYTYLSHEKPQHKTQIQLSVLDIIPEQRLKEISYQLKSNLAPYGLKCLYLVIEECGRRRTPWFLLDTNRCLDLLGHKRNKKNVHYSRNKTRLLKELEALTQINFNIERRSPSKGNKEKAFKFRRPLLSVGEFEEKEVKKGQPFESGKTIRDGVEIFIHPQIYEDINDWYTHIPNSFLSIDARSNPHAILLYPYIANQWRIGLSQHGGVIRQSLRQILDGAGLLSQLPKRKNQQKAFINRVKDNFLWLKEQPSYWIKGVRFESRSRPLLDQIVIIEMADEHPLRTSMKQIKKKRDGVSSLVKKGAKTKQPVENT